MVTPTLTELEVRVGSPLAWVGPEGREPVRVTLVKAYDLPQPYGPHAIVRPPSGLDLAVPVSELRLLGGV